MRGRSGQKPEYTAAYFLLAASMVAMASCLSYTAGTLKFTTECVTPSDQTGTYDGIWENSPVPVALRTGEWSASEIESFAAAAESWNSFYTTSKNFNLVTYQDDSGTTNQSSADVDTSLSLCSQGIIASDDSGYDGSVLIFKRTSWGYDSGVIALTTTCSTASATGSQYERNYMGVMEMNYQNYFTSGNKQPDLESIFLHELGHLVGLNHSCEVGTVDGFPDCTASDLDSDYYYAVMYPVILFPDGINGGVRRTLQTNDQQRANCLHEAAAATE